VALDISRWPIVSLIKYQFVYVLGKLNPKTVLDVGKALGKYGFLLHEYVGMATRRTKQSARTPAFKWVNTALGNTKVALVGTYRAVRKNTSLDISRSSNIDSIVDAISNPPLAFVALRTAGHALRLAKELFYARGEMENRINKCQGRTVRRPDLDRGKRGSCVPFVVMGIFPIRHGGRAVEGLEWTPFIDQHDDRVRRRINIEATASRSLSMPGVQDSIFRFDPLPAPHLRTMEA
jgi:hypothetical protein